MICRRGPSNSLTSRMSVCSVGCYISSTGKDTDLSDSPALCGQDTRAASHPGPSGDTGHAVPFPSTPASWPRGSNCPHKSTALTRIACRPCSPGTGKPAQAFSCLEAELHVHDQLWQHHRHHLPPTTPPHTHTHISDIFRRLH